MVHDGAAEGMMADVVEAERAAVALLERVGVVPEPVGAAQLHVDETMRRFPRDDPGAPAEGQAMDAEAVIDHRAGAHLDRRGRDDVELQKGRREFFQIRSVGEEGEDFGAWARKPLLGVESEFFHG